MKTAKFPWHRSDGCTLASLAFGVNRLRHMFIAPPLGWVGAQRAKVAWDGSPGTGRVGTSRRKTKPS